MGLHYVLVQYFTVALNIFTVVCCSVIPFFVHLLLNVSIVSCIHTFVFNICLTGLNGGN